MLPAFELVTAHVEFTAIDDAQQDVALTDLELPGGVAHGRAAITAAAGLVKHHRAVDTRELADQLAGGVGEEHAWVRVAHDQKKPMGFSS